MHKQGLKFERRKVVLDGSGLREYRDLTDSKSEFGIGGTRALDTCVRFRAHVRTGMCMH